MDRIDQVVTFILGFLGIVMLFISVECLNQATEANQFIATGILMAIGLGSTIYSVLKLSWRL